MSALCPLRKGPPETQLAHPSIRWSKTDFLQRESKAVTAVVGCRTKHILEARRRPALWVSGFGLLNARSTLGHTSVNAWSTRSQRARQELKLELKWDEVRNDGYWEWEKVNGDLGKICGVLHIICNGALGSLPPPPAIPSPSTLPMKTSISSPVDTPGGF